MDDLIYETQTHGGPGSPIIFHYDTLKAGETFMPHLHEGIEILYFNEGSACVCSGETQSTALMDDIVIINSGDIHTINVTEGQVGYFCLIIDKEFCELFDIYIDKIAFEFIIKDEIARKKYEIIKNELQNEDIYYKTAAKAAVISLLTYLCRNHTLQIIGNVSQNNRVDMVKKTIKFIQSNYNKNISIDEISDEVGFSKYYLCHVFKKLTGFTLVSYLNFFRCKNAENLLYAGNFNVSEVAHMCGFENLSYFSKTYKKHMGILPSELKM